jgi:DNA-binding PadR family transcriptional regulator
MQPITATSRAATTLTVTEYAVLGVLVHVGGEVSGYDLRKLAETSVGYIWRPSKTHLYTVLRRLVAAGAATERDVPQRGRPDKRLFRATVAGEELLRLWLARDEPESDPDQSVLVLKLFFGAHGDPEALARQLRAFREAYAARLAVYERMREAPERGVSDRFTRLTLGYGIARARAAVTWADFALEELHA